tara:strand:- start:810 stop:1763 length:954 start_codon:yes stop_codon:yes gene_type:complete
MAISAEVLKQELNPTQASYRGGSSMHGILKFPQTIGVGEEFKNHMSFEAMKVSGGVDTRTLKFQETGGSVWLPIPSGSVQAAYQQGWEQHGVGFNMAALASNKHVQGALRSAVNTGLSKTPVQDMINAIKKGKSETEAVTHQPPPEHPGAAPVKTAPAGMEATGFVMAIPLASSLAEAAQYSIGKRAVEQTMMSYSGPGFRSFQYNFSLRPTSDAESLVIEQIIGFFKIRSAPKQEATQFTRIYNIPEVFKIRYYYGSKEHDKINRIGHCALTDMTVSYGGDKFTTFADNHAPVQVDLSLQFKEMELLNQQMVIAGY